jgi:pimeloyl-ACP methyl ester carboxylesterase
MHTTLIDGVTVHTEGSGEEILLMLHGWPDSYRLWDSTVAALKDSFVCVRFTLPGFDADQAARPLALADMTATLLRIVQTLSPDKSVTLLLHDWGCVFGYEFAAQYPDKVTRIVAVDIGDHNSRHFGRALPAKAKWQLLAYQLPLALVWWLGRHISPGLGTWLTRQIARGVQCPTPRAHISWKQNYPYAMVWFGLQGGFKRAVQVQPACPVLFIYGERKPFMFHSPQWLARLNSTPGSRVQAFATGHWVMLEQPQAFVDCLRAWLPAD